MSEETKSLSEIARSEFGDKFVGEVVPAGPVEKQEQQPARTKPLSQIARETFGFNYHGEEEIEQAEPETKEVETRPQVSEVEEIPAPTWRQDEVQMLSVIQQEATRFQNDLAVFAKVKSETDLNAIAQQDKARAAAIRTELTEAENSLKQRYADLQTAAQDIQSRAIAKNRAYAEQYVGREHKRLMRAMPDLDVEALASYLGSTGFSKEEIAQAYDHRVLVYAEKARRYDALMAEKSKPKKVIPLRKGAKPRVQTDDVERLRARFKRTGRLDDAVALLKRQRQTGG